MQIYLVISYISVGDYCPFKSLSLQVSKSPSQLVYNYKIT